MKSTSLAVGQIIVAVAAVLAGLYFLRGILIPLVIAAVLTLLVNALVRWFERRWPRAPRWAVMCVSGTTISLALAGGMYVIANGAIQTIHRAPQLSARVDRLVGQAGHALGLSGPLHLADLVGDMSFAKIAGGVFASAQDVVSGLILTIIYFGFMLASHARVDLKIRNLAASSDRAAAIQAGMARIESDIETYMWVQTVTGLMLAVASGAILLALGVDNAVFWTVAIFLLSYIPTIGVTIGSVVVALFALVQFETAWQGIAVLAGIQMVAFVVGNLIYPRLQAQTQNIDPVSVILALSFWTFMWGIAGALLAVPLTLIVAMICAQWPATRWITVLLSNDGTAGSPLVPPAAAP